MREGVIRIVRTDLELCCCRTRHSRKRRYLEFFVSSNGAFAQNSTYHAGRQTERRGDAPLPLCLAYPNGFEPLTFRVGV